MKRAGKKQWRLRPNARFRIKRHIDWTALLLALLAATLVVTTVLLIRLYLNGNIKGWLTY